MAGAGKTAEDSTRPTILSVSPSDGATGIPITTSITATFSEAMNPTSINDTTFTIAGAAGSVSYADTTATLTPSADLAYGTTYTATVTTGVKDATGNSMAADYIWSFTTRPPPGSLDVTFGTAGTVTTAIGSGNDEIHALGIQADGKIVVAGYARVGANDDFALARYNPNGTLDTSFGSAGTVTTFLSSGEDHANALGIQADGKIVVAGWASNGANYVFALARYLTDGKLDTTTFGTAGTVTTTIGITSFANALGIQADGKIVVAGSSSNGINNVFALARYTATGATDTTFGSAGITTTTISGDSDAVNALGIQSDGKIVAAGNSFSALMYFALARYTVTGALDTTFGFAGITTTSIGMNCAANALGIQSDGRIVTDGYTHNGANYDFALARYLTNGAMDPSFGSAGTVTIALSSGDDYARALGIQGDVKIVAAGWSLGGTDIDFALVRYWP